MDNTIIPYQDVSESSEDELGDSSSDDEYSQLLSNNIGVIYNKFISDQPFMNMENQNDYQKKRNKLFTPQLSKIRILIDSKNIIHTTDHNTSSYTVSLNEGDDNNSTSGYQNYKNVIGFRLIKAILPNSLYQVNPSNNTINFMYDTDSDGGTEKTATLNTGTYDFEDLGEHIAEQMSAVSGVGDITVAPDPVTLKYTISVDGGSIKFYFLQSSAWRILGLLNKSQALSETNNSQVLNNVVDHSIHFVDLVIPEIPYSACKHNMQSKNIIDRIPLYPGSGNLVYYTAAHDRFNNYFFPINLSKLTIQLYEDSHGEFYHSQNGDNSFEFELTILNQSQE